MWRPCLCHTQSVQNIPPFEHYDVSQSPPLFPHMEFTDHVQTILGQLQTGNSTYTS